MARDSSHSSTHPRTAWKLMVSSSFQITEKSWKKNEELGACPPLGYWDPFGMMAFQVGHWKADADAIWSTLNWSKIIVDMLKHVRTSLHSVEIAGLWWYLINVAWFLIAWFSTLHSIVLGRNEMTSLNCQDEEKFRRNRELELKHGRICIWAKITISRVKSSHSTYGVSEVLNLLVS